MKKLLALLILPMTVSFGQSNVVKNGWEDAGSLNWIAPHATFATPPSGARVGTTYIFTDTSGSGRCIGGGTDLALCVWSGTAWVPTSGGGVGVVDPLIVSSASISRLVFVDNVLAPTSAPTAVELVTGTEPTSRSDWAYCATYITLDGETMSGPCSQAITTSGHNIQITNIPVSPNPLVTGRNLYRRGYLIAVISDNITTSFLDNVVWYEDMSPPLPLYSSVGKSIWVDGIHAGYLGAKDTVYGQQAMQGRYYQHNDEGLGWNVAIGDGALWKMADKGSKGNFNTGVGSVVLAFLVRGSENTCIGVVACEFVNQGSGNTGVGSHAMRGNYAMNFNTYVGRGSGYYANNSYNTALGAETIRNTIGEYNTALGFAAGGEIHTTSSHVTYVGAGTRLASTTQHSYLTVIGSDATGDCDNCIVVGRPIDVTGVRPPTSCIGWPQGTLWNNNGVPAICP